MKTTVRALLLCAAGAFWWIPAMALEPDQVRGEVVEVQPEENLLRLRVLEAGDGQPAREGQVETYELTEDVEIRRSFQAGGLLDTSPMAMTRGDLFAGDRVILTFEEIEGRRVARGVDMPDDDEADDAGATEAAALEAETDRADDELAREQTDDFAREETEAAQFEETGAPARLPATASLLPAMALAGLGFAGAALLMRRRRR
jgi:LPXTG-motif cell wall-anchored protein